MPWRNWTWRMRLSWLAALAPLLATAALAQNPDEQPWLDVPNLEYQKPWLQWLFGAGFVILCLLVAFKNPHRSHLD